jgi:hypothetical protein
VPGVDVPMAVPVIAGALFQLIVASFHVGLPSAKTLWRFFVASVTYSRNVTESTAPIEAGTSKRRYER